MKYFILVSIAVIFAVIVYEYKDTVLNKESLLSSKVLVEAEQYLPEPLRAVIDSAQSHLTVAGVLFETNQARKQEGLLGLKQNSLLDKSAQKKLEDMFAKQYFDHISPQGVGPAGLASGVGYEYVVVGENLALGRFKDDKTLVEAWMNSPGHRANILHKRFSEIGIAVGKGQFEGRETWLAVQSFATPLSACPEVSGGLKVQLETNNQEITVLQIQLEQLKQQMAEVGQNNPSKYNELVFRHNVLADRINNLIDSTKSLTGQYNGQVNMFNNCLKSN